VLIQSALVEPRKSSEVDLAALNVKEFPIAMQSIALLCATLPTLWSDTTWTAARDANHPPDATLSSVPDLNAEKTLGSGEEENAALTASNAEMIPMEEEFVTTTMMKDAELDTSEETIALTQ